jgi:tetrahydromethanopterin S-methyltransferase subunit G
MERGAWTDARLDDRFNQIDRRFDQVDKRFDQVDRRFDRVDSELRDLRGEMNGLRAILIRFNGGIMVGLLGVIAAILARGA